MDVKIDIMVQAKCNTVKGFMPCYNRHRKTIYSLEVLAKNIVGIGNVHLSLLLFHENIGLI